MKPDLAERPAAPRPSAGYSDLSGKGQERACENALEGNNGQLGTWSGEPPICHPPKLNESWIVVDSVSTSLRLERH